MRGHNFENSYAFIVKLINKIKANKLLGIMDYYKLGKVIHYVADAFTFPHNKEFKGSLSEHCHYEGILHNYMKAYLNENNTQDISECNRIFSEKDICMLHKKYIEEKNGYVHDCRYIVSVTKCVLLYLCEFEKDRMKIFIKQTV